MGKTLLSLIIMILTTIGCVSESQIPESIFDTNQFTEESIVSLHEGSNTYSNRAVEKNISQENELTLSVNGTPLAVKWEDNESVFALFQLVEQEQLSINMEQYGNFEQVGNLSKSVTSNDEQMTAEPGDIVLYSGNSLVIFYGSNTWAYTKLGHIEGLTEKELESMLNENRIAVTLHSTKL
ncbi:cyclophilin-like fold protein [Lachnospiraceae bacterium NSJ-143]|nr:cyclophilin-like fold protein [Lachnospiraceae bacterium NSJ-143]